MSAASLAVLAGCTMAPAPETDPALRIVLFDAFACTDAVTSEALGISAGHPKAGAWVVVPCYELPATPESSLTDICVITGTAGILQLEVSSRSAPDEETYWAVSGIPDGPVLYIRAAATSRGALRGVASAPCRIHASFRRRACCWRSRRVRWNFRSPSLLRSNRSPRWCRRGVRSGTARGTRRQTPEVPTAVRPTA